jgi:hypothetical protein
MQAALEHVWAPESEAQAAAFAARRRLETSRSFDPALLARHIANSCRIPMSGSIIAPLGSWAL